MHFLKKIIRTIIYKVRKIDAGNWLHGERRKNVSDSQWRGIRVTLYFFQAA
jgi:hypothetical protein